MSAPENAPEGQVPARGWGWYLLAHLLRPARLPLAPGEATRSVWVRSLRVLLTDRPQGGSVRGCERTWGGWAGLGDWASSGKRGFTLDRMLAGSRARPRLVSLRSPEAEG